MLKRRIKPKEVEVNTAFRIPQINASYEGLLQKKRGFQKSPIGSALFGSQVKDEIHVIDNSGVFNVDLVYESFRSENDRHTSDEELIKKHGTKFFEFQRISNDTRKELFGTTYISKEKENKPKENKEIPASKSFSFIEDTNSFLGKKQSVNTNIKNNESVDSLKTNVVVFKTDKFDLGINIEEKEFAPIYETINEEDVNEESLEINDNILNDAPIYEPLIGNFQNQIFSKPLDSKETEYILPPISSLEKNMDKTVENPEWLETKKDIINQTLLDFDVSGEVVNYTKGPAFTRYEIMLQAGVKVNKITNIYDNLQMSLGARSIRIQAPIPGKNTVGIEVPNDKMDKVFFGEIVNEEFIKNKNKLMFALGKNIDGKNVYRDLADMPHCLIGGATKSGKSVCINTLIISLLLKNTPKELKFILIDPKAVELRFYDELPHLVTPVITDAKLASESLKWVVEEMERRYSALSENRVRNIDDYNLKSLKNPELDMPKMPYIVIIIDEFADLMMASASDVEDSIQRITQKARASGIHLVIATQRPVVEFVKGSIKANIPTRIAFKVASFIDSNTILDEGGAENLLGKGDMLVKDNTIPERLQGAFISDDEINAICDFIRSEELPDFLFTHEDLRKNMVLGASISANKENSEPDDVLYSVALFCIESGSCSINSIQQQFNYGFNRAQKIVNMLEERQIVSPKRGTKGREILVDVIKLNRMYGRDE